jgi:hypothetical protein
MLADEGCKVVCLDLSYDWANQTVEMAEREITQGPPQSQKLPNITDAESCETADEETFENIRRVGYFGG